jgi:hypothetical protein
MLIELVAVASLVQPAAGLSVQKIWTAPEIAGRNVSIAPDPSKMLIVVDVTASGAATVSLQVGQLVAEGRGIRVGPVGAAPGSLDNFDAFLGIAPGWRIVTDANNREVKMGHDSPNDPIQLVIAPGASASIVYIVPKTGPPLSVTLPGVGAVVLVAK